MTEQARAAWSRLRRRLGAAVALYGLCAALPLSAAPNPARVLVVVNDRSADSTAVGAYYMRRRRVPANNLAHVSISPDEECSLAEYRERVETPVRKLLSAGSLHVDFILLTKGLPIRVHEGPAGGFSVDGLLASMDWDRLTTRSPNPYFGRDEPFSHARFGLYLVTRITGYSRADCLRLIDNASRATAWRGPFLLHTGPGHEDGGYRAVNDGIRAAQSALVAAGFRSVLDVGEAFPGSVRPLAGYFSWGSNDPRFDRAAYDSLRFLPGAIAETAVSTSARTFENPRAPGQSLIGDLVAQGVTGCKGYVSEPFADSIARAEILFSRYTSGYTLAESFYMASRYIHWKDMVIGDPLCAPYEGGAKASRAAK